MTHLEKLEIGNLYNMDCLEAMRSFPDKSFDIAIVDPPYGGGGVSTDDAFNGKHGRFGQRFDKYHICADDKHDAGGADLTATPIKASRMGGRQIKNYYQGGAFENDIRHWDYAPPKEYFEQLFRISKHQVIWGGNYFDLPATRCFIVWRKTNIPLKGFTMSPCEYAWTSFNRNAEMFEYTSSGNKTNERFHPTQKPIELYEWTLDRFAKDCKTVLDTHAGSASLAIACHRLGFDYMGFEIDKTYYRLAQERIENEKRQMMLF